MWVWFLLQQFPPDEGKGDQQDQSEDQGFQQEPVKEETAA
jgi:hypothetical protein